MCTDRNTSRTASSVAKKEVKLKACEGMRLKMCMILASFSMREDLSAAVKYGMERSWIWMSLTIAILVIPVVVVGFLTLECLKDVKDSTGGTGSDIILGSLYRYWLAISARQKAQKSRKEDDERLFYQRRSDLQFFLFYMSIAKSAPQAVVQVYIFLNTPDWNLSTASSAALSVLLVGTAAVTYDRDVQQFRSGGEAIPKPATAALYVGRCLLVAPRLCFMGLIAISRDAKSWLLIGHNFVVMLCVAVALKKKSKAPPAHVCIDRTRTFLMALAFVLCISSVGDYSTEVMFLADMASLMLNMRLSDVYLLDMNNEDPRRRLYVRVVLVVQVAYVIGSVALFFYRLYYNPRETSWLGRVLHQRPSSCSEDDDGSTSHLRRLIAALDQLPPAYRRLTTARVPINVIIVNARTLKARASNDGDEVESALSSGCAEVQRATRNDDDHVGSASSSDCDEIEGASAR